MAFGRQVVEDPDAPKSFEYEAINPTGVRLKAKMTAPSAQAVTTALQADGWIPISVDQISDATWNMDVLAWHKDRPLKLPPERIAAFARQLYQLLQAGVSIPKAIASLGEEEDSKFMMMCEDVSSRVAGGQSLSKAFAEYPACFDDVFCSYIESGEITGSLKDNLARLAHMLERKVALNKKIKSVTAYPKFVSITILVIVTGIMMFMVPMFAGIYKSFGATLPVPTQILVATSHIIFPIHLAQGIGLPFVGTHFATFPRLTIIGKGVPLPPIPIPNLLSPLLWLLAAFIALRIFLKRTVNNPEIGIKVDRIKYRLPLFGKLLQRTDLYRWSSTLAGGLASGISMQPALDLAARASGSRWQRAIAGDLQDSVQAGKPLSEAMLAHRDLFPPNIRRMVATGEQAGELDTMLDNVATAIDDEIEMTISNLGAKIEVALILVMGAVVGGILVALYLPILNLTLVAAHGLAAKGTAFSHK
jgi:type IV pilus assembly protein PilC